jgi:hypothetical protein
LIESWLKVMKFEVLKIWKIYFAAKCRVMATVIFILRAEERMAKGRIGCLRERKVLRKGLATFLVMVTWEGGLKEAPA